MLTIDCKDVSSVQNELLVYVADKVEAIPTLKKPSIYSIYFR